MTSERDGRAHLWQRVDALIDRAPTEDDLRSHGVEVLAARRFRALGKDVPPDFVAHERYAAIVSMTAPLLLERVRAVYDGPAVVLKGPEVAARYEEPLARGYGDIDLLVPDAEAVHAALLAAGFEPVGDPDLYLGIHHLRPLAADGLPLSVEVHSEPKWFGPAPPPGAGELFAAAKPSATGVDGLLTLPKEHHTLVLAVHSWAHEPLRRLRDLIDVAAMAAGADHREIERLARSWQIPRLWRTTRGVVDALFADGPAPWPLRLWARNLRTSRDRTVFENHLQRWLSDFWSLPFPAAAGRLPATLAAEISPEEGETWPAKLSRSGLAFRNALRRRSHHHRELARRSERD